MFCRNSSLFAELISNRNTLLNYNQITLRSARKQFHNKRSELREGFQKSFGPDGAQSIENEPLIFRHLTKPLLFSIGFSATSFVGCVIWQYEEHRRHAKSFLRSPINWYNTNKPKVKSEKSDLAKWWDKLRDSEKVFYPILLANVLVFAAWRVRSWQPFLLKYFCANPSSKALCSPMVLSTFSHYSTLHIAANMYVLYSFMPPAVQSLGKEQFLALYLSAGVMSSFASYAYKVAALSPGLSLGASGAIMAVLSYVCVAYPDTRLSIIFLPMFTFDAGTAIKFVIGLDVLGVLLGWRFFDHAAHLGGAIFGMLWYHWGNKLLWEKREPIMQYWHALRESGAR